MRLKRHDTITVEAAASEALRFLKAGADRRQVPEVRRDAIISLRNLPSGNAV
jgi:hypothetical protein